MLLTCKKILIKVKWFQGSWYNNACAYPIIHDKTMIKKKYSYKFDISKKKKYFSRFSRKKFFPLLDGSLETIQLLFKRFFSNIDNIRDI